MSPLGGQLRQLKPRHPFVPVALELLNNHIQSGTSVARWAERRWTMEWRENASRFHIFIKDVSPTPPRISFPKLAWVKLNHLQTGVGLFRSEMHKWGMASTAAYACGVKEQTTEHVIRSCPIHHHSNGDGALSESTKSWRTG